MSLYNPYRNIFFYYRGPSLRNSLLNNTQVEDNATKALINTLEGAGRGLLFTLLRELEINQISDSFIEYNLQIDKEISRPDASISYDGIEILIESKVNIPLTKEQIYNHLENLQKGYLICITNNENEKQLVKSIDNRKLRFITWSKIYLICKRWLKLQNDQNAIFIVSQFLEYLEIINMAPFSGWNRKDFEAFLNIEEDTKRELRLRVKNKFKIYLDELYNITQKEKLLDMHENEVGNLKKDSTEIWGAISRPPLTKIVHIPHFNFIINADTFSIGIQIEGKAPTRRVFDKIKNEKENVLGMLNKLDGFVFIVNERVKRQIRVYNHIECARIFLNKKLTLSDINYIVDKSRNYPFFEYRIAKYYMRDAQILNGREFLNESVKCIKQLKEFYDYCSRSNS